MKDSYSKLNEVDSRVSVMINDLLSTRDHGGGRVAGSSFKRIPSVKAFKVKIGQNNEILDGTGLERRMKPDFKSILFKKQNNANKYMENRIKAMKAVLAKNRPDIFWAMVHKEMRNSVCFRTSSFNAVFPGWYKNMDFQRAVQINFGVEHILRNEISNIKYFRVEIPKGKPEEIASWFKENPGMAWPGKMRPLGVPTAPWRVVLHMWNGFLTLFLENELKQFNHAYMPGVGTMSAIAKFLTEVRHAKYIYEFDIKGFFNNVNITEIATALRRRGMPNKSVLELQDILMSAPENLSISDCNISSKDYDMQLAWRKFLVRDGDYYTIPGIEAKFPVDVDSHLQRLKNIQDYEMAMNGYITTQDIPIVLKGLPQGAAPSTILSLLALTDWYYELKAQGINLLMYADDGMLYSDKEFEPFPPEGFDFAEDKCAWVKGKTQKDKVKFLGITYSFEDNLIRGSTRTGSTLEFGPEQKNFLEYLRKIVPHSYTDLVGALVQSNIFGLALSKLYGGKFGKLTYEEDIKYHKNSYWARYHNLVELQNSKSLEKTASTTACGWLLILTNHIMSSTDKDEFFKEAKEYHTLRPWELTAEEVKAAIKEQAPWDKDPNWFPHQGSAD